MQYYKRYDLKLKENAKINLAFSDSETLRFGYRYTYRDLITQTQQYFLMELPQVSILSLYQINRMISQQNYLHCKYQLCFLVFLFFLSVHLALEILKKECKWEK